jgi:hypothetical protein
MTNKFKRLFQGKKPKFSLGICIPVWNRGDLFSIGFNSLINQLNGINATIWIFDNGSDQETRDLIYNLDDHPNHRIIRTFFPENMGIPYVANVFAKCIQENCDFAGYQTPQYIMMMDSDAFFKKPVVDMIGVLEKYYEAGLVSGHDSIEHHPINEMELDINGKKIPAKEKENERMITMLMRKEEFLYNYPFPHFRNRDVDWEITQWHPNSLMKRNRKIFVLPGYVLHLGIKNSTWKENTEQGFASEEEVNEVRTILQDHGQENQ